VLANLLSNALRHTPSGGRVSLGASFGPDSASLTVTDTGDGIEAEHLQRVFERFYRTDTARSRDAGGTGIGLAVSAAIAAAHGGTLTAASEGLGLGSVFTLTLPANFIES
jgi:signal transduction histidine kinase